MFHKIKNSYGTDHFFGYKLFIFNLSFRMNLYWETCLEDIKIDTFDYDHIML